MKRVFALIATGVLFLVTTGMIYVPKFMNQGLAGIELTFLSNFAGGFLLTWDGLRGLQKKKQVRQEYYLAACSVLLCVLLISVACIGEANFSGPFMFLHVINPMLFAGMTVAFTYQREIKLFCAVAGTVFLAMLYLIYVIIYGYYSGDWLYSIVNVQEKGIWFVVIFFLVMSVVLAGLEWALYKSSEMVHKRAEK